ncbi:MAG: ATP-dependent DNA helicase RecG [Legionellales bacterium]|jgi:ATP-dependent DNA helicase RecG
MLSITKLKGVGTQLTKKLNDLGIFTITDLLFHLPYRYQDRTKIYPVASLQPGMYALIEVEVVKQQIMFGKRRRLEIQLADSTGYVYMSLFNFSSAQRDNLKTGTKIRCFGEVSFFGQRLQMVHPEYQIEHFSHEVDTQTLTPIYPSTEGFSQKTWRNLITQAIALTQQVENYLPDHPYSLLDALIYCHQPPIDADQNLLADRLHPAQQRLALEELLAHHLSRKKLREKIKQLPADPLQVDQPRLNDFYQQLPFKLTGAQLRVLNDIFADLNKNQPMLRLLQGDVGSGKTVVAAASMLAAISNGYQAALMAPTEILANQHYVSFKKYFKELTVVNLTSRIPAKQKQEMLEQIKSGQAQVIMGTHALIQQTVEFNKLGLVVIDEQHRFGVEQRLTLQSKAQSPHQLMMTATPIPRTLAMTLYADLDYSVIDELPPNRKPITTIALPNSKREQVIDKIRNFCKQGQQAYWVCTLIEESETLAAQAATDTQQKLIQALPEFKIGLVHGQLKSPEKQAIMESFKRGEINLLVATTVIEVGVDVPNANLMIIENPERLGLAQLHQLRGRVGRGENPSHCILLYQSPLSFNARARLDIMRNSNDGFKIAEKDLAIRGSGEFLGTKQSGELTFRIANLTRDQALISQIQHLGEKMLRERPEHIDLLITRWLGNKVQYGTV